MGIFVLFKTEKRVIFLIETKDPQILLPEGLSSEEAKRLKEQGLSNVSKEKNGKSYLRIVTDNLLTFFNILWGIVAILMIACNSFSTLTFLAIIIPNVLIAIVQECRAKHTVEKLSATTDPKATVVRDGVLVEIDSSEIVLGDVVCLSLGQQILADGTVLSGVAEANESMLTGESNAIKKSEGDKVLAGSYLVSGKIFVKVSAVGKDNYIHTIEKAARSFSAPASNLFRDLNRLLRYISFFLVPCALVMFFVQYAANGDVRESIIDTSGGVIGMIPAGIFLLITVTLTLSVISLAKKRTLVQDMYSIEMLAAADVVCLDKTGTITDGTMCVTETIPLGGHTEDEVKGAIALLEGAEASLNATSKALVAAFGTRSDVEVLEKLPFSSERKYSATLFLGLGAYALGAPHFVPAPVSEEMEATVAAYAKEGKRVLLLARLASLADTAGEPIALIAVAARIRPSARETIEGFQSQGVAVKIISGDHAATVSSIAARVGVKNAERYVSCEGLSDAELEALAEETAVFGRVSPEQKVLLVKKLKSLGHTVALTGDGVNDTLALKEANCSIAMAEGSEMALKVSKIVLLDSDFSTLPDVVREGRRCINNVKRSATLFLMKTMLAMCLSLLTAVSGLLALIPGLGIEVLAYPFQPKGLVLLEMFVIGAASVLLALEPNNERIEGSFIKTVLKASLPNGIALLLPVLAIVFLNAFGVFATAELGNTLAMVAVLGAGLVNLWVLAYPYTKWRLTVCAAMTGATVLAVPLSILLVGDMFEFGHAKGHVGLAILVAFLAIAVAAAAHAVKFLVLKKAKKKGSAPAIGASAAK